MSIDVPNGPVDNLVDEQWHLLLHALHRERAGEGKQCNDAAPFDTVTEQLIDDGDERGLRVVGSDVQLVTHVVKHLKNTQTDVCVTADKVNRISGRVVKL